MFNKLSPVPITEPKYRNLMIFAMLWMFIGAWVDASAHRYVISELESFFTPWHGILSVSYTHLTLPTKQAV